VRMALLFVLILVAPLNAQLVIRMPESWSSGQRGPLPVRVHFFSSSPSNVLDSAAVHAAAQGAMIAIAFPPDVKVSIFPIIDDSLHVQMDVNVYQQGEVRFASALMQRDMPLKGCRQESQWSVGTPITAVVHLTHQMRSALECVVRSARVVR
jgi:hypothetical protein